MRLPSPHGGWRLAARVAGEPYDSARLELFTDLREEIERVAPSLRPAAQGAALTWLPFFEAYFSNYIEGTRFSVEEAPDIAIDGVVQVNRPQDAHDVSATFRIVSDATLMREMPSDADNFLDLMVERHRVLMAGRESVRPGLFKQRPNYAGGTAFVAPDLLVGTLRAAWEHIDAVVDPFHRAVMTMFVVTECHPFDDGNGRVARILTNAELVAQDQARIVVTNSYRRELSRRPDRSECQRERSRARLGARLHPPLGRCRRLVRLRPVSGRRWTSLDGQSNY